MAAIKITPTVGRMVLYVPGDEEPIPHMPGEPLAALVAKVNDDGTLNLGIFDANGKNWPRTSVVLVQDGEPQPPPPFCKWMAYQVGQAAKTEALEKQLAGKKK